MFKASVLKYILKKFKFVLVLQYRQVRKCRYENTFLNLIRQPDDIKIQTEKVSKTLNFDFLEMAAITGAATFASVTPVILNEGEEKRLQEIFAIADSVKYEEYATICDWTRTAVPSQFEFKGNLYNYNWYEEYKGARHFVSWME